MNLIIIKTALLSLFLIGAGADQGSRSMLALYGRVNVDIWNRMSNGEELTALCASGDDKLGKMSAGTDVAISFNFQPNWRGTTLFYCTLTRGAGGNDGKLEFNVYEFDRDYGQRCRSSCKWEVEDDGVHGYDESTGNRDMFYAWGPALID